MTQELKALEANKILEIVAQLQEKKLIACK